MLFLPLISIVYGGILPAGLFIYWIVSTVFSIVQQYLIVGWGAMFPLFGWTPALRRRPHAAVPGVDATATRAQQRDCGHPTDAHEARRTADKTIRPRERGRQGRRGRRR